jgi:hypothetical protein
MANAPSSNHWPRHRRNGYVWTQATGERGRYAIGAADRERYPADDEDEGTEELACLLKLYYLLFSEPGELEGAEQAEQESRGGKSDGAEENQS